MKSRFALMAVSMAFAGMVAAQTGSVSGKVIDGSDKSPLFGVKVRVANPDGTLVKDVVTEEDGTYSIKGLGVGKPYKLVFSLEEYVPDLKDVTATAVQNSSLMRHYASAEYWKRAAAAIRVQLEAAPGGSQHQAFLQAWNEVKSSGVSAEGKAEIARSLKGSLPQSLWSASPSFLVYVAADPKKLKEFETAFEVNSYISGTPGLDPLLFEDIKATQRKYHDFSRKEDRMLIQQLKEEDGGTIRPEASSGKSVAVQPEASSGKSGAANPAVMPNSTTTGTPVKTGPMTQKK